MSACCLKGVGFQASFVHPTVKAANDIGSCSQNNAELKPADGLWGFIAQLGARTAQSDGTVLKMAFKRRAPKVGGSKEAPS